MADITVPKPPALLPKAEQKQWRDAYVRAFKQAQIDCPEDVTQQNTLALKEANRLLRVDVPESYEDAMKLPDHHCLQRGTRIDEKTGAEHLLVVTIDAKKYRFPVPKAKEPKEPKANGNGSGNSKQDPPPAA